VAKVREIAQGQPGQTIAESYLALIEDVLDYSEDTGGVTGSSAREIRVALKSAMDAIEMIPSDDPLKQLKAI